jgi:hypothetical protein
MIDYPLTLPTTRKDFSNTSCGTKQARKKRALALENLRSLDQFALRRCAVRCGRRRAMVRMD